MPTVTRNLGYTNGLQRLTWTGTAGIITAHLWGGGGGAGGSDASHIGGNGSGGAYASTTFNVSNGDIIDVAVGGQGGQGRSSVGSAAGGAAGASYGGGVVFNTRTSPTSPAVYPYSHPSYCSFLNTYGVWEVSSSYVQFQRTYTVNFPSSGLYTFTFSVDNDGEVRLDGSLILSLSGSGYANFQRSYQATVNVSAGYHTISINAVNTSGPGSVALLVSGGNSYGGGAGGTAGYIGSSGGGGGGGGATVILLNNSVVAVAGGGGGGGGAGDNSNGGSSPGSSGNAALGVYAGQNGQTHPSDGGGGGGGGGGYRGGNGGASASGDNGGFGGSYGISIGSLGTQYPSGITPANTSSPYYKSGEARGATPTAAATPGFAAIVIETAGMFVRNSGQFRPVSQTYVKDNDVWKPVKGIYVNQNGTWKPIVASVPPAFNTVAGGIGVNSRPY